jgi:hypothetical protein
MYPPANTGRGSIVSWTKNEFFNLTSSPGAINNSFSFETGYLIEETVTDPEKNLSPRITSPLQIY